MNNSKAIKYFDDNAAELSAFYNAIDRVKIHRSFINCLPKREGLDLLDIGSGSGADAALFASMGHNVLAIEPADKMRELAKKNFKNSNIEWIDDVLPELKKVVSRNKSFDAVYSTAVINFLDKEDRLKSLKTMVSLLKTGGVIELQYTQQQSREYQFIIDENEIKDFVATENNLKIFEQKKVKDINNRKALDGSDLYLNVIVIRRLDF